MKIAAVIAEYNPFHLGHEYMLTMVRNMGYDGIIAVMSGNFVQRGDAAISDKRSRAKMAISCGADLVIELPLPYAVASAQKFAQGSVEIIKGCGIVDAIAFGSECGDVELIKTTADIIANEIGDELKKQLDKGITFAAAREKAVASIDKKAAAILKSPNDTLAVEYVTALGNCEIEPIAIKRIGAAHDGDAIDGFASASQIRQMLLSGDIEGAAKYMPTAAAEILKEEIESGNAPVDLKRAENAVISHLRRLSVEDIRNLPDVSEGLENRILDAIRKGTSLDEIISKIKSKRYTMARIRRILLLAYLGVSKKDASAPVPYIRILAANQKGRQILKSMKKSATLPIITRTKEVNTLDKQAVNMFS
ncbi:MAG: nucleotidyltransferase family protein, partial [Clostridia bacterium]|nr:nucleotidyltransferase family protein [Clostridia bacterium]